MIGGKRKRGLEAWRNHCNSLGQDKASLPTSGKKRFSFRREKTFPTNWDRNDRVSASPNLMKKFIKSLNKEETRNTFHPILSTEFLCLYFLHLDVRFTGHTDTPDIEDFTLDYFKQIYPTHPLCN